MLRSLNTLICTQRSVLNQLDRPDTSPFIQIVRWRKRRWAPKPASKIFYVRQPTPIDPEENEELKRRTCDYTVTKKAIRLMWRSALESDAAMVEKEQIMQQKIAHHQEMSKLNDGWNAETGRLREAHQEEEERAEREAILNAILKLEQERTQEKEKARQMVLQEKLDARNFITEDTLEEEIEKALNSRVNYNYAIDSSGNKYIELSDLTLEKQSKETKEKEAATV